MRRFGKALGRLLLILLIVAAGLAVWKREQIARLHAVITLFEADRIVGNFSHMDQAFLTAPVPRGDGPVAPLPPGQAADLPAEVTDWIETRSVTGLLVLKDGQLVHESYHQGTGPDDLRISWSMAKSYLSVLFGVLHDEGVIPDLYAPVTEYAPELAGSAYDGATILDVLQMSSGVTFDEDYLDFWSDINKMGRVLALGRSMDGFAAALTEQDAPPGQAWHYVSIDTHIVGMVIRGATGRGVPELLAEKVIGPLGVEAAPYYVTDGYGVAFVLGGLNATLRDYARFGLMVEQGGVLDGRRIVSEAWITQSVVPSAKTAPGKTGYGYQWWIPKSPRPGEVYARGIYGQYIYIDRTRNLVIATTGADRLFREPGVHDGNIAVFRAIADALD